MKTWSVGDEQFPEIGTHVQMLEVSDGIFPMRVGTVTRINLDKGGIEVTLYTGVPTRACTQLRILEDRYEARVYWVRVP